MAIVEERLHIGDSEEMRNFLDFFDQSPVEEESSEVVPKTAKLVRVSEVLRDDKSINKCFEPMFVSIGPYHHGNPKFEVAEGLKRKQARHFVSACSCSARTMYYNLYNNINQIRGLYENEPTIQYNDEALTRILFVDGCFLLYFIYSFPQTDEDYNLKKKHIGSLTRDICLLENQLPFLVLKLLGENNFKEWPGLIVRYIEFICNDLIPIKGGWKNYNLKPENSSHLVQLLQTGLQGSNKVKKDVKYHGLAIPSNYSVTELREVGIHCKPSRQGGFKCTSFSPHWFHGVLEIPSIAVGLFTRAYLLNLIAYEMHPDVHDSDIQSYIFFLALLLRQPQDVKALREARVLYNYTDSDEELVEFFKEIAAKSGLEKLAGHHRDIRRQIGSYLDKRGRTKVATWLAEVFIVYFRSPWTTVTVLAGFLVLFATIIQTILQIVSYKKNVE